MSGICRPPRRLRNVYQSASYVTERTAIGTGRLCHLVSVECADLHSRGPSIRVNWTKTD